MKNHINTVVRLNYKLVGEPKMVAPVDRITIQARQGSVAAIIQVLNEKLAEVGVRTRAVFTDGVLQLLCEAAKVDQLEQSTLVERIRQILEGISPRYIRRVNINSRIVREQQLLWLEEISRDPENQLLWSKQIILAKPNFIKRFLEDTRIRKTQSLKPVLTKTSSSSLLREHQQFQRGIVGGLSLSLFLLVMGLVLHNWLNSQTSETVKARPQAVPYTISPSPVLKTPASASVTQSPDGFAQAVRLAQQAADSGKTAQTREDWLAIATKWQQASELMGAVAPAHPRYDTAVNRTALYRQYSEDAQQEAQKY
ncbi:MAG TPA: hypothetical protein VK211_10170 [Kamptonema sp.]|nr:hypothetical protein [Kamptonema sp.]